MRTAPRAQGIARAALGAALTSLIALLPMSCNNATQVVVLITTDVPCEDLKGVSITTGDPKTLDTLPPGVLKTSCTALKGEDEGKYQIGDIVVTPSAGRGDKFGIRVVVGVTAKAEQCAEGKYNGCVVARRAISFIEHETLQLPIFLSSSCEDVPCLGEPIQTCVLGQCVTAEVPPNTC